MAKVVVAPVVGSGILSQPVSAANTINSNFTAIQTAMEKTLSRDGTSPNQMTAALDMNHQSILNVNSIGATRIDALSIYINGVAVIPGTAPGGGGAGSLVTSVAGRTGDVSLTKADVGLGSVDNTSDASKPISTATQTALDGKLAIAQNLADLASADTALLNLGGGLVGLPLFKTATQAAALSTIGAVGINSPAFTGTPTAPTPAPADNTGKLATTSFVVNAIANLNTIYQGISNVLGSIAGLGGTGLLVRLDANNAGTTAMAAAPATGLGWTNPDGIAGAPTLGLNTGFVPLTDAANIDIDLSQGKNFSVTIAGNRTLNTATNPTIGQTGLIMINQDAVGTRTLGYASTYKWAGGTPGVLSTPATSRDVIEYRVLASGIIQFKLDKAIA